MKPLLHLILTLLILLSYSPTASSQRTVGSIDVPPGFSRVEAGGFGAYLRALPLKPEGSVVRLYNGLPKVWQRGAYAVIDMEIGEKDLQQCADAVIRLRAEYLWAAGRRDEIRFNFTSGFRADYAKWAEGYRIRVKGNEVEWYKGAAPDTSHAAFRKYLDCVFMYAGSASLSRELAPVSVADLQIGDVFIIGGHPGHAMIIVDMATDGNGKTAILVAQSYMPAQDIHIVTNLNDRRNSPWYVFDSGVSAFDFPEWSFTPSQLKRFRED